MKILAIDTCSGTSSVAVSDNGQLRATGYEDTLQQQASGLIPLIADVMRQAGVGFEHLDLLACATGPGGFTSVRIGVATIQGLAFASKCPAHGVPLMHIMAYDACKQYPVLDKVRCAIAVGRKEYAVQDFCNKAGNPTALNTLSLISADMMDNPTHLCCASALNDSTIIYLQQHSAVNLAEMLNFYPPAQYILPMPVYARAPDAAIAKPLLQH